MANKIPTRRAVAPAKQRAALTAQRDVEEKAAAQKHVDATTGQLAGEQPATFTPGAANAQRQTAPARRSPPVDFEKLKAQLSDAAGRANIAHALRMLSVGEGAVAKIARAIIDDGSARDVGAALGHGGAALGHGGAALGHGGAAGVDEIARTIERLIAQRADKATGAVARLRTVDILTEHRAGAERQRIFALEPVELPKTLPPPPNLQPRIGFEPGVEGVRLDVDHSIHDLQTYIHDRFGKFALEDLIANGRTIEVHHGAREEAFSSLVARGYSDIERVRTPEATMQNELYLARNEKTGDVRWVVAEVWGANRMAHLQKLLFAAEVGGRAIDPKRVEIHTEPMRRPEEIYRRTARALLASGTVPASVVVGFKNSLLVELGRRAAQGKRLEFVQQTLGPDPARTLMKRAADARCEPLTRALAALGDDKLAILAEEPSMIFRFSVKQDALIEVERALTSVARSSPDAAELLADVVGKDGWKLTGGDWVQGRTPEGTFIDQQVITYIDAEGAKRSLLLTKNPYGEVAHELGRVLVDNGVENVFVFGTAGALDANANVGDTHAPTGVMRTRGTGAAKGRLGVEPFHNVALDIASSLPELVRPKMKLGSIVANVRSPVDETLPVVNALRDAGADIVEMELSHLVRALKGSTIELSAIYLVSDVPGTEKTIEKQADGELKLSLRRATDLLIEGLGMRGVVVAPEPQPAAPGGFEGALILAERALAKRGISGPFSPSAPGASPPGPPQSLRSAGHSESAGSYGLMRLVIARYLMNGLSDKALGSLVADEKADALASARVASRWQEKALRELASPATDQEIVAHIKELGRGLKDAIEEVRRLGGKRNSGKPGGAVTDGNYRVHILGSVIKGRASKGSDLDVLIETKDEALRERVFDSRFGYRGKPRDSDIVLGDYEYVMNRGAFYGPTLCIDDAQRIVDDPDALVDIWAKHVAPFGVSVTRDGGSVEVRIDPEAAVNAKVERETEAIAERLLEHEKSFRRFVQTDFLLRYLKELEPLADVVDVPLERLVRAGEVLVRQRLSSSLDRDRILDLLATPLAEQKLKTPAGRAFLAAARVESCDALLARVEKSGLAGLPWELFVDGELACELMRVGDPFYRLCVDLASAQRAKTAHSEGGGPVEVFPFFAREVRTAMKREQRIGARASVTDEASDGGPPFAVDDDAALRALDKASIGPPVIEAGAKRKAGLGITVPLMRPLPSIDLAAYVNAPLTRDLSKMKIAVASDHGAFGRAENTAEILKRMGVGEVVVLAPTVRGEKVPYAVTSHAALSMLERGEVDRVVSFCGNGLGALDTANQHAEHPHAQPRPQDRGRGAVKPPIYGDNLWSVVDGSAAGANVLCMGGRLLDVGEGDPMAAFLKAFLDAPPVPSPDAPPVHGVTSTLVDGEPKRITKRTLEVPISEAAKLSPDEARRVRAHPVVVYFNPDDPSVRDQVKTLRSFFSGAGRPLPNAVRFVAWNGKDEVEAKGDERVLLLSEGGAATTSTRAWGSFRPEPERVHRAAHKNGVASFAREGGRVLDLPCGALTDAACGGRHHDVLRLLVKTFLLESDASSSASTQKPLYGDSVRFTAAKLDGAPMPDDLASWSGALNGVIAGARRF